MEKTACEIEAFKKAVGKEKRRLIRELKKANCPEHKMKVLDSVIQNTAWMRVKLDEVRAAIETQEIVIEYDNGGGQKGVRENPFFKSFMQLWKSYMLGMNRILDALPEETKAKIEQEAEALKPVTVLDQIRGNRKGA